MSGNTTVTRIVAHASAGYAAGYLTKSQPLADPEMGENLWRDFSDFGSREPHAIDIGMRGAEEVTELPAGPTWEPARSPSDGPPTFNGSQAAGEPERTGARAPSAPS